MPTTKVQGAVFGLIMSYAMAIGMEIYNTALRMGLQLQPGGLSNLTGAVFVHALQETAYMGLIVFVVSSLWGNAIGGRFAARHCDPSKDNPYLCRLLRQGGTVAFMCPAMSLTASILFSVLLGGAAWPRLPAIWVGTVLKNFPMAFFWNFFAAAPFTHWLFGRLFPAQKEAPARR